MNIDNKISPLPIWP